MTAFEQLPKASFDGIEFPLKALEISGGLRDHVHEYPHSPGGAVEKLGRKLYTIRMTGIFDTRINGYGDNLWPGDLSDLRDRFEDQVTSGLLIPTIGTIQAYAVSWTQRAVPEVQSGEELEVEFREDQSQAFLFEGLINVTATTLQTAGQEFDEQFAPLIAGGEISPINTIIPNTTTPIPRAVTVASAYTKLRQVDVNQLAQIRNAFTTALSYSEQPERYTNIILTKTEACIQACALGYQRIELLKNPLAWSQVRAFKRVWSSAQKLRESVAGRTNRILFFTAQTDTNITAVSRAIYGDSSWGGTLLRLNAIENPFRIPKGSVLRYYDPATMGNQAA